MKDERIQTTVNKYAAGGFIIYFVLMTISINYRLWILKQHPRDFWDFIVIFLIVNLFVFIAYASKGAFDYGFKRFWLTIFTVVFIVNFTLFFIMGLIDSVVDVVEYLIGFLLGMIPVIGIAYFLNRRWKRKEGIEDEK
ncbi:MAG: DUF6773 family protein [Planctomycetota bacterium]|jgi:uncharacterized membrane protein